MITRDVCFWGSKIEVGDLIHLLLMLLLICSHPVLSLNNGVNPLWSSSCMSDLGHKWAYSSVNSEVTVSLVLRQLLISLHSADIEFMLNVFFKFFPFSHFFLSHFQEEGLVTKEPSSLSLHFWTCWWWLEFTYCFFRGRGFIGVRKMLFFHSHLADCNPVQKVTQISSCFLVALLHTPFFFRVENIKVKMLSKK